MNKILEIIQVSVADVMGVQATSKNDETLQSILGMVHTLIIENRTQELSDVLNFHFPKYYSAQAKLFHSIN